MASVTIHRFDASKALNWLVAGEIRVTGIARVSPSAAFGYANAAKRVTCFPEMFFNQRPRPWNPASGLPHGKHWHRHGGTAGASAPARKDPRGTSKLLTALTSPNAGGTGRRKLPANLGPAPSKKQIPNDKRDRDDQQRPDNSGRDVQNQPNQPKDD
jgi:hypothetical protein